MASSYDHQRRHTLLQINSYDPPLHAVNFLTGKRLARFISMFLIGVLAFIIVAAGALYLDLSNAVTKASTTVIDSHGHVVKTAVDPNKGKPLDILVIGQDAREGNNGSLIGDSNPADAQNHQADTTMVMHISADRKFVDLVSIPRDSLVSIPACATSKGTLPAQNNVMFNSIFANAYAKGGDISSAASCTMNAVNHLTGLKIKQFIVVDFSGLSTMINALHGVDICVTQDFRDSYTNLSLTKGLHHLNGVQATQYARIRHGLGDGSDVMRTIRQQYLIKMLLREATRKNLFTQTDQLYQMAKSALESLNMSSGLADINVLMGLAGSMSGLKTSGIYTQTIPVKTSPVNPNRVQWTAEAPAVWKKIAQDRPLTDPSPSGQAGSSSSGSSQASPEGSSGDPSSQPSSSSPSANQPSSSPSSGSSVDPDTGLITQQDGTLIDPKTGGIVDKKSGAIRDPHTGWYIGMAEKYVNHSICKISN